MIKKIITLCGLLFLNTITNAQVYKIYDLQVLNTSILGVATGTSLVTTGDITGNRLFSTVSIGTPPFSVISTTNVPNLNASFLNGATFSSPGAIGNTTPNSGAFTNLTATVPIPITSGGTGNTTGTATINANLTGVITSVGNVTNTGSQTGTGNIFAMSISPTFTGIPAAPTASLGTNTTQLATTAFTTNIFGAAPAITQVSTGQVYQNLGARINRINDREFVGSATINDGLIWGISQGNQDYVSQNIPTTGSTSLSQLASLSSIGGVGGIFGTRSSDGVGVGTQSSAIMGVGINNYTTTPVITNSGYFEAQRKANAGITPSVNIQIANQGAFVDFNPYSSLVTPSSGSTFGVLVGSGAGRSGVNTASAAITIGNNGSDFNRGLVFQNGSLSSGEAISMYGGNYIRWYTTGGQPSNFILNEDNTTKQAGLYFNPSGNTVLGSAPSANSGANSTGSLTVNTITNAVNQIGISGAILGAVPIIAAQGTNANIGITIDSKGSSGVVIKGNTTGDPVPAGYYGEFPTPTNLSTVSLTNGVAANVSSVALGSGVWDVSCVVRFNPGVTTKTDVITVGVSTTSATFGAFGSFTQNVSGYAAGLAAKANMASPTDRLSLASPTTAYCVTSANFSISTMTADGSMRAMRAN